MTKYIEKLIHWLQYDACSDCVHNKQCNAKVCIIKQIAMVLEEIAMANDDLMLEIESKQNRINKLQSELEQMKKEG